MRVRVLGMIGARRKCVAQCRSMATSAPGSGSGGRKGKDGSIDFDALFKSVGKSSEKKESAPGPIDFKKLFGQTSADKGQFKLDLTPPKKEGASIDSEKLRIDLGKLFSEGPGKKAPPGEGGLPGFKLDFSKIKARGDQPPLPPKDGDARRDLSFHKMGILNKFADSMGPSLKPIPPKDHLLEKYLSLENMSAPEFQKVELQRVRNEFKLHDADNGSSGVQIAALTKKISFLSKHLVAHKKDVPSRRGMNTMLQRRRKLLIYLRRTDWEMYCHVLTRLSLKDRLEVSYKARQAGTKKKDKHKKRKKSNKKRSNKYARKANDL